MLHSYVMDKFLNKYCLSYTGSSEESDLTALGVWLKQVDYFVPRLLNG